MVTKVVIPIFTVIAIFSLFGGLMLTLDVGTDIQAENYDGAVNKTTDYAVDQIEKEVEHAIWAPFIPYLIGGIVAIAKIFGITLIFR